MGHLGRVAVVALGLCLTVGAALGADARSRSARAEFMRQHPCPASGKHRGPCPGYEVDHKIPLKCNGADAPHNMQWLTVEQHRIKTKREAGICRR